jgi:hypothetical protein
MTQPRKSSLTRQCVQLHLELLEERRAPSVSMVSTDSLAAVPAHTGGEIAPSALEASAGSSLRVFDISSKVDVNISPTQQLDLDHALRELRDENPGVLFEMSSDGMLKYLQGSEEIDRSEDGAIEVASLPEQSSGDVHAEYLDLASAEAKVATKVAQHVSESLDELATTEAERDHQGRDSLKAQVNELAVGVVASSSHISPALESRSSAVLINSPISNADSPIATSTAEPAQLQLTADNRLVSTLSPVGPAVARVRLERESSTAADDAPAIDTTPDSPLTASTTEPGRPNDAAMNWEPPSISASDVVSHFTPFDPKSIKDSIDSFLSRLHQSQGAGRGWLSSKYLAMLGAGMVVGLSMVKIARRRDFRQRVKRLLSRRGLKLSTRTVRQGPPAAG